jgi:hypothetical protein
MEALDKRLGEFLRLQNRALDLSGLKIGPTDAIKVVAVLPQWCVEVVISPGKDTVHAMAVHAMESRVLALIKQLLLDYWIAVVMNSIVRTVRIVAFSDLILFERYLCAEITVTSCSPDVCVFS